MKELELERNKLHLLIAQSEHLDGGKRKEEILEQSRKIDAILEKLIGQQSKDTARS